jgi:hypothetical protein
MGGGGGGGSGGGGGGGVGGGGGGQRCACAEVYFPVCADGKDYSNQCEVRRAPHARGAAGASAAAAGWVGAGPRRALVARNDAVALASLIISLDAGALRRQDALHARHLRAAGWRRRVARARARRCLLG